MYGLLIRESPNSATLNVLFEYNASCAAWPGRYAMPLFVSVILNTEFKASPVIQGIIVINARAINIDENNEETIKSLGDNEKHKYFFFFEINGCLKSLVPNKCVSSSAVLLN